MIKFLKIRDVKSPVRDLGNAGIDVFVPNYSEEFFNDLTKKNERLIITHDAIFVRPQESVLIPLGLKTHFNQNLALELANKSGVASKKKLFVGASVIDSSYQGEIHAHLVNVGNETQTIAFGEKITQIIPRVICIDEIDVFDLDTTSEDFYEGMTSSRGEGGFGSTGIS